MNDSNDESLEQALRSWSVETTDLTSRVAAAIGGSVPARSEMSELLDEIRALRTQLDQTIRTTHQLQEEVSRLRITIACQPDTRIAPFSPTEGFAQIW